MNCKSKLTRPQIMRCVVISLNPPVYFSVAVGGTGAAAKTQGLDSLFEFLNLGHWDLFEIWYLVLGIFVIFAKRVILAILVIYVCN